MAEFKIGRLRYTWKGVWATTTFYNRDAVVSHRGKTYVCIEPHTSTDFDADLVYVSPEGQSLPRWVIMVDGRSWIGGWEPDAYYAVDNIVSYGGVVYLCTVAHTSGALIDLSKWTTYAQSVNWTYNWLPNTYYKLHDIVKYGGRAYECKLAHTSSNTTDGLEVDELAKWTLVNDGVEYKGEWTASGFRYKTKDIVKFNSNLWIANVGHVSSEPFSETEWDLWIPGLEFGTTWDVGTVYQLNDIVIYGGYSYKSTATNNTGNIPSTSADWALVTTGYVIENEWSNSVYYAVGSVVNRSGQLYVAIQDNTNQAPTAYTTSKTYTATGSSGTTLKVSSTTGITKGMIISGPGFTRGQQVVVVNDSQTLTITESPDDSIIDLDTLTFIGVNYVYWSILTPGTSWKNRWNPSQSYIVGDIVVLSNVTYQCIVDHQSSNANRPDTDTLHHTWITYLQHDRFNVLNTPGDLVTMSAGQNAALEIGDQGYLLKSVYDVPTWSDVFVTPSVFYVAPSGTDAPTNGTNWDRPWKTIKYACDQVALGALNPNSKAILKENKEFIVEEMFQYMVYESSHSGTIFPLTNSFIEKTKRDARYIIDAIIYDISKGGNSQTVAATLAYFNQENTYQFISTDVANSVPYFIEILDQLFSYVLDLLGNITITPTYQTLNSDVSIPQTPAVASAEVGISIKVQELQDIVITALTDGNTSSVPPENAGLTTTIFVKTGTYKESLPIIVPDNTALVGDELRGVVVQPMVAINTIATRTFASENTIVVGTTEGMTGNTPVQFVSMNSVNGINTVFGGVTAGQTYYVVGGSITSTTFQVSTTPGGSPVTLVNFKSFMKVYGGQALGDMFRVRNGSGIRNMTLTGLLGTLTEPNQFLTRRPTGGAFVSLDPGLGVDDTSAWIFRKSPYVQNVTNFGIGCTGLKIDGALHAGGNKSIVCNDFTQILSDGFGIWCTGSGSLCEAVSVFSYYSYAGYFAEHGGRIRATNGNSSYGTYGVIAEGYDDTESPITGLVYNKYTQASASVVSSLGSNAELLKIEYSHAGEGYSTSVSNLLKYSNLFTNWSNDGNVTLVQSIVSPFGDSDAWIVTGNTSGTNSSYIYQNIEIAPSGASYVGLSGTNITGNGVDATFNVIVQSDQYIVTVNATGSGYVVNNQISIAGSALGGIDGINDLTITVASLSGSAISTITSSGVVSSGSMQPYTISMYCKRGSIQAIDLQAIYSGNTLQTSAINFNFSTLEITGSSPDTGSVPVEYSAIPVSDGWYRLSVTVHDKNALNNSLQIRLYPRGQYGNAGYTLIYGFQVEVGSDTSFYLETQNNQYESYANYKITGAGANALVVADEIRSKSIFQARITSTSESYIGGDGYLVSSNNAQDGNATTIVISASDVATENQYLGMRLFVNSGTGAGQYGYISNFDEELKVATILKESFDEVEIIESNSNKFTVSSSTDINTLYVNQQIQFLPTSYTTSVNLMSQDSVSVLSITGGTVNTLTVSSTARLEVNMAVTFTGDVYGGVTSNFTYYIIEIIDESTVQISTTLGGAVWLLNTSAGSMSLNYPSSTNYVHCDATTHMDINLPIVFTGVEFSDISTGVTYYINEVIDETTFTISPSLVTFQATVSSVNTNYLTVDSATNLTMLYPVKFIGTGFGGISANTNYYINKVISSTQITLTDSLLEASATSTTLSSKLITVSSTEGFILGNPVVFVGTTFGNIVKDRIYYISYIASSTEFSISSTASELAITATATAVTTNQITVNSSTNLVPLFPIVFRGTNFGNLVAGTTYYVNKIVDNTHITVSNGIIPVTCTATEETSNLITVSDTAGFVANNPIIFSGNTFGGLTSGIVYYILAINNSTTLTVSASVGGSAVTLSSATGNITARTTTDSVVLSSASGTLTGYTTYTGAPVSLTTATGEVIVRTASNTTTLTAATGSLSGTTTSTKTLLSPDTGTLTARFEVPMFGGVSAGTSYYIKSITTGISTSFDVSETLGGSVKALTNATGSMQIGEAGWDNINPGTPDAVNFNSTTVYYIEPRINFSKPSFLQTTSSFVAQAPSTSYVSIGYGNGHIVALPNENSTIAISQDGTSWTPSTLPTTATWSNIAYGNKYWVIISTGGTGSGSKVLYSNSNLETWKTSTMPSLRNWKFLAYGNGKFVALAPFSVLGSAATACSTNYGATWAAGSGVSAGTYWTGLCYGAGKFVAISSSNHTAYSTDGVTWTETTAMPRNIVWSSIAYGNGRFVAIPESSGKSAYSFDGITWYDSVYDVAADKIAYGQGVFFAIKADVPLSYISEDGVRWTVKSTTSSSYTGLGFVYTSSGAGAFIATSANSSNSVITFAGAKAKGRASISTSGTIEEIKLWETGSNYNTSPQVVITDPNVKIPAEVSPRIGNFSLSSPSFINNGTGYNTSSTTITVRGSGYADDYQVGLTLVCNNLTRLPSAGDSLTIAGSSRTYKVTSATALDGTVAPAITSRIEISPPLTVVTAPAHAAGVTVRTQYSQARLTNHDYLNIGFGNFEESNYPRLPIDTMLSPQSEVIETNNGRVFFSSSDQDGNFRVGNLFAVEQATGIVTLSASQFGLQGLTQLKLGGIAVGGNSVIITQFSTDPTFVANSNSIIPTQKAIKSYLTARLSQGGANTFTGQLIAGTVLIGGPDKISSTIAEGNEGSHVLMPVKVNVQGENAAWGGDGAALSFFMKSLSYR